MQPLNRPDSKLLSKLRKWGSYLLMGSGAYFLALSEAHFVDQSVSLITSDFSDFLRIAISLFRSWLTNLEIFNFLEVKKLEGILSKALVFCGTAVGVLWLAWSTSFMKKLKEIIGSIGTTQAEWLVKYIQNEIDKIWWRFSGFEAKYCDLQATSLIKYKTEGWQLPGISPLLFEEVFVPLGISKDSKHAGTRRFFPENIQTSHENSEYCEIWHFLKQVEQLPPPRSIAVLAAVGYGKTSLLKHITICHTTKPRILKRNRVTRRVPILINLRQLEDFSDSITLAELIVKHHIPNLPGSSHLKPSLQWSHHLLSQGRAIVMLDGFDEISKDQREKASLWIHKQIQKYHNSIFIITSRHEGFQDYRAEKPELTLYIKQFNRTQQQEFLKRWYRYQENIDLGRAVKRRQIEAIADQKSEDLISQIQANSHLEWMAKNPLLLTMIATLHYLAPEDRVPQKRADLYQKILNLQLEDRSRMKKIKICLPGQYSQKILQRLALALASSSSNRSITESPDSPFKNNYFYLNKILERVIQDWLKEFDLNKTPEVGILIDELVESSQILVEKREYYSHEYKAYEFSHLSFQEYLAAAAIKALNCEKHLVDHAEDSEWREIILFYAAQQENRYKIAQLIQALCQRETRNSVKLAHACVKESPKFSDDGTGLDQQARKTLNLVTQKLLLFAYDELENYLMQGQWEKADEETYMILVGKARKNERDTLTAEDFKAVPVETLKQIDWLWSQYSRGRFGFKQQKKRYSAIVDDKTSDKRVKKFARKMGWLKGSKWLNFTEIDFNFDLEDIESLPIGYLPIATAGEAKKRESNLVRWNSVIDRIQNFDCTDLS